ncbi:MAG: helix-hairpin-helix domain-containing protein [Pseudomonadota bacterium]|nr:helix-hairpin-helix domain-containing protein [Pseudomonadota bacterium]
MIKKMLAVLLALFAAAAFAAVDANKATLADLEAVKGIGPSIAGKIVDERKKGSFKDWQDLVDRVKGVGDGNAAKFSTEGLTVNGAAFAGAPAKPAAPAVTKQDKPAVKADAMKPAVVAAPAVQADAKPAVMSADDKKAAAKKEKEDKKAAKTAAAEEAKKAKAEKAAAKKAAAVTPAAAPASAAAKK